MVGRTGIATDLRRTLIRNGFGGCFLIWGPHTVHRLVLHSHQSQRMLFLAVCKPLFVAVWTVLVWLYCYPSQDWFYPHGHFCGNTRYIWYVASSFLRQHGGFCGNTRYFWYVASSFPQPQVSLSVSSSFPLRLPLCQKIFVAMWPQLLSSHRGFNGK